MIAFISGGARSGKSSYAEQLALSMLDKQREHGKWTTGLYYVATAQANDMEMKERIGTHQQTRSAIWQLIEEPYDIRSILQQRTAGDIIVVDCLTLWVSNISHSLQYSLDQMLEEIMQWVEIVNHKALYLLIVSNDVNEGVLTSSRLVHEYVWMLEAVHQRIITQAEQAIQVIAGMPFAWKNNGPVSLLD